MTEQTTLDFEALDEVLEGLCQQLDQGMSELSSINVQASTADGQTRNGLLQQRVRLAGELDSLTVKMGDTARRRVLAELAYLREAARASLAQAEAPMAQMDALADKHWGFRQQLSDLDHQLQEGSISSDLHASEQARLQQEIRRVEEDAQEFQAKVYEAQNDAKLYRIQAEGRYHVGLDDPQDRWVKVADRFGQEALEEARKELRRRFGSRS